MKLFALFGTIVLLGLSTAAGAATPEAQVMAPIRLLTDCVNKGDMNTAATTLSPAGVAIMDDIAPHVWTGPNAFDTWSKAYGASEQAGGLTEDVYTLGKPTHVSVEGDRGYVVVPMGHTFKQKGVAMKEAAHMVFTLQKGTGGWLITGFTWAAGTPKPAASAAK